jgi:hypothetical protein
MSKTCDRVSCSSVCLGNIPVDASGNVCTTAEGVTQMPLPNTIGNSIIVLTGSATDPDMGPRPLSYDFALSATQPSDGDGIFEQVNTSGGTAWFECTGTYHPVSITMTVSDGDPTCTGPSLSYQTIVSCALP